MGLKVAHLKRDKRTVVIPIDLGENEDGEQETEDLTVTYQPSGYTPDMEDDLNKKLEGKWKSAMGISFITNLLLDWDLVQDVLDDDGNVIEKDVPVPISEAGLRPLPNDFLGQVVLEVSKDMGKRRQASAAG